MTNTHTPTPGQHIGPLPTDEQTLASMQAMHAQGYRTTLASTWDELQSAGIEPDHIKNLEGLA